MIFWPTILPFFAERKMIEKCQSGSDRPAQLTSAMSRPPTRTARLSLLSRAAATIRTGRRHRRHRPRALARPSDLTTKPKPLHAGHAPSGLLNENSPGVISGSAAAQFEHKRFETEHHARAHLRCRRALELDHLAAMTRRRFQRIGRAASRCRRAPSADRSPDPAAARRQTSGISPPSSRI